jgi:integrase
MRLSRSIRAAGVKTPPVPKKPRRIITAAEFDLLYQALPNADARLLVETDIESGLRWGELTELRARDLDQATRILTVSRAVVTVPPEEHPSGGRFLVKDYPKEMSKPQCCHICGLSALSLAPSSALLMLAC